MIFCRDRVSYDDFGDCHDEIIVAGVDFIGRRPIYGLYLQGDGCFWEPLRGQQLQVIDLIVDGGREELKVSR
jgi:hypothetical protein